ncbi:SAM-dependent methyltransferase [Enterococcus plantarum]|uniref:SAM-dependent methyltransferase n=1 Tax=Enterococcus plantarum TaxID=1077675 RepID=A0A2W3ZAI7_9ENTE|nr:NAD(P)H-binding protein [Enterococcus plantarum]PZL76646.1 SAM-dependent methyltransferase [Enterococcus plantarum]
MKILILGAAGQISRMVTELILTETDHDLVLYGRNLSSRISVKDPMREVIIEGDFNDQDKLKRALIGVDIAYLNDMSSPAATQSIVKAMEDSGVNYLIGANVLGIYNEVAGAFGRWNANMVGSATHNYLAAAEVLEQSLLDYVILRLTWLYNQKGNEDYELTQKGEPFIGAQVTREAVARLIMTIIHEPVKYAKTSLGVSEPNTDWAKPSFY